MDKVENALKYEKWVEDFCAKSDNILVKNSAEGIRIFLVENSSIPNEYRWKFTSDETFSKQAHTTKSSQELNYLYWIDFARNCEAYTVMTCWRTAELLLPAIRSLNLKEIISSAVLARSLLELSSSYLLNANIISKELYKLEFSKDTNIISSDLEALIVKAIWGSRLEGTPDHLKQKNCLAPIQKLSKHPDAKDLLPTYEYLCEIAHPNLIGNARFWSHIENIDQIGTKKRVISRKSVSDSAEEVILKTIWSLAWSSVTTRNAIYILQGSLKELIRKLSKIQG